MKRLLAFLPAALVAAGLMPGVPAAAGDKEPPLTGFEESEGAAWTTHEQELSFLQAVDARSKRAEVSVIGKSVQSKPLHLVSLGHPAPKSAGAARSGRPPCSSVPNTATSRRVEKPACRQDRRSPSVWLPAHI